jgi:O-antigen/teichoic acid export membrane protein
MGCVAVSVSFYIYFWREFGLSIGRSPSNIRGLLKEYPSFVEFSLASYIIGFVMPLVFFVVRTTMLSNFGPTGAGLLQAALGISLAINLVLNPLNGLVLTPFVNRVLDDSKKHLEAVRFQKKLLLAITLVSLPPCLFPDLAVTVLYSSQFVEAAHALYLFVLSQAMMQICGVYTALMIGLDRLKAYAIIMVAGFATNGALAMVLVPPLGLIGAGIAALVGATLLALGTFGYLRTRKAFRIGHSVGLATLLLFVGLGLASALIGTRPSLVGANLIGKSLVCVVGLGLMALLTLNRDELRSLFAGFSRV